MNVEHSTLKEREENFKRLESFLEASVKPDYDEEGWWAEPTLAEK
jgi:hypothetical protein